MFLTLFVFRLIQGGFEIYVSKLSVPKMKMVLGFGCKLDTEFLRWV